MTDREFYAAILARVLVDAGASIVIGGPDSERIIRSMAEAACCKALRDIRDILDDGSLEDGECFHRIEGIVSVFETLGPGAGSRHDFG